MSLTLAEFAKSLADTGVIDAEGTVSALGVSSYFYMATVNNSGTITAHSADPANTYAIDITETAFQVSITNSGTINGQIGITGAGTGSGLVTNTGTGHINGDITFADHDGGYGFFDDRLGG